MSDPIMPVNSLKPWKLTTHAVRHSTPMGIGWKHTLTVFDAKESPVFSSKEWESKDGRLERARVALGEAVRIVNAFADSGITYPEGLKRLIEAATHELTLCALCDGRGTHRPLGIKSQEEPCPRCLPLRSALKQAGATA